MKRPNESAEQVAADNRKLGGLLAPPKGGKGKGKGKRSVKEVVKGPKRQLKKVKVQVHRDLGARLEDGWLRLEDDDPRAVHWLHHHFYGSRLRRVSAVEMKSFRLRGVAQPSLEFLQSSRWHLRHLTAASRHREGAQRRQQALQAKRKETKTKKKRLVNLPTQHTARRRRRGRGGSQSIQGSPGGQ
eukprot:EG_transcript_31799